MKYLSFLLLLVLLSGCSNNKHEQQVAFLAEQIEQSFLAKDYTYLNELASFERMMEKAYVRLRVPYKLMKASVKALSDRHSLSSYLINDDYETTLKVISYDENKITISIFIKDLIINYVDLIIKPVKGELKVVDIYLYQQGFSFSDEMVELANILKNAPKDLDNFYYYLYQVKTINQSLRAYDIITAKYLFKQIKGLYTTTKMSKSLHIAIASYDLSSNLNTLLEEYIHDVPNQTKYVAYLQLMKNMYRYDCSGIKQSAEILWQHTGIDSFTLKYYEDCITEQDYITN